MLLCYCAGLNTRHVYSGPVSQWAVVRYFLQPDVIDASHCGGVGMVRCPIYILFSLYCLTLPLPSHHQFSLYHHHHLMQVWHPPVLFRCC